MKRLLPPLAAIGTAVFVGATMVATRFVIDQSDPASLALLRYVVGFLCLMPPLMLARRVRFESRDVLPVALLGIGQFGILIALLNFGLQYIGAGLGAVIFATLPFLTMLLAAALGREALSMAKALGVVLSIAGVACALSDRLFLPETGPMAWLGAAAVLGSALSGAICAVYYRPYLVKYPPLQVGAFAMLASVFFLALLAIPEGFFATVPSFTPGGWLAVLFIGASSGIGYFLWLWALQNTTPTRVTIFMALSPMTATALGALLLSEPITPLFLTGLAAVAAGLVIAHWPGAASAS